MHRSLALPVVLCALLASACQPLRDNPADPANAPHAGLLVVDTTTLQGCSSDFGAATTWPTASVSTRNRCLALDARSSSDPQADALEYRFTLVGTAGETVLADFSTAPGLVLDSNFRATLPVRTQITFRVAVRDPSGSRGTASAALVLLNSRPEANADAPRSVPVGGNPWAPGQPVDVRYHARSYFDADGDAPQFLWDFSGGTQASGSNPDDPAFHAPVDASAPGRALSALTAFDGDLLSFPSAAIVTVESAPVWSARLGSAGGTVERLADRGATMVVSRPFAGLFAYGAIAVQTANGAIVSTYRDGGYGAIFPIGRAFDIDVAPLPSASPAAPALVAGCAPTGIGASVSGNRVWFGAGSCTTDYQPPNACPDGDEIPVGVVALDVVPAGGAFTLSTAYHATATVGCPTLLPSAPPYSIGAGAPFADQFLIAAPDENAAWIATRTTSRIERVSAGTSVLVDDDPALVVSALAARPDSDEAWAIRVPASFGSAGKHGELIRYRPSGTPLSISFGADFGYGLSWISHDEFWIGITGRGLVLVDATDLDAGLPFEVAVRREIPQLAIGAAVRLVTDAQTGTAWGVAEDPGTGGLLGFRAGTNGSFYGFAFDGFVPQFVDAQGGIWSSNPGLYLSDTSTANPFDLFRADSLRTPNRISQSLYLKYASQLVPELDGEGGLWSPVFDPQGIEHVALDGTPVDIAVLAEGSSGTLTPIPHLILFRVAPGGSSAWGVTRAPINVPYFTDSIRWYDLSVNPPRWRFVGDQTLSDPIFQGSGGVIVPSAPVAASTPFAWTVVLTGSGTPGASAEVGMLSPAGTLSPVAFLPAAELPPAPFMGNNPFALDAAGALMPADNSLCLATFDLNTNLYHVRRYATGGAVTDFGTIPAPPGGYVGSIQRHFSVAVSSDASGDVCWVVANAITFDVTPAFYRLRAFRPNGTLVHSHDEAGAVATSVRPEDSDRTWLTLHRPNPTGALPMWRAELTFVPGAVTTTNGRMEIPTIANTRLLGVQLRPDNFFQ